MQGEYMDVSSCLGDDTHADKPTDQLGRGQMGPLEPEA